MIDARKDNRQFCRFFEDLPLWAYNFLSLYPICLGVAMEIAYLCAMKQMQREQGRQASSLPTSYLERMFGI